MLDKVMTDNYNSIVVNYDCEDAFVGIIIPNTRLKCPYVRVFQPELMELAKDERLSGIDLRVLLAIWSSVDFENRFEISLSQLAREMDRHRPAISRSVSKLSQFGYIKLIAKCRPCNHYMVNPYACFKSRSSKYVKLLKRWDELNKSSTRTLKTDKES